MPELPEVETTCRGLRPLMEGQTIVDVSVNVPRLRVPIPADFKARVVGKTVRTIWRRAKYVLMDLEDLDGSGGDTVIVHLGMSGRLVEKPVLEMPAKHDHVIFHLPKGVDVRFNDARRFGLVLVEKKAKLAEHALFKNLGPEPFSKDFMPEDFFAKLQKRSAPVKNVLMDNSVVVGVGNIYANEALFRAKIHPERRACDVTWEEVLALHMCVVAVLAEAIAAGGTTLRDYVQADGALGYFHMQFRVYGRNGEACLECKHEILKKTVGQRGTFFCEVCQK